MYTNTSEITLNPESKDLVNALEANASQVFASFVDEMNTNRLGGKLGIPKIRSRRHLLRKPVEGYC